MTSYEYNFKNKTDGIDLLASLDSNSIKVAFFDPQYVCDSAAGGYSVLQACKETNRYFIGGDIEFGELPKNF